MKITKDFKGLTQIGNGDYVLSGDLICEENIEIELDDRLIVRGRVETSKSIIVKLELIAGEGIKAGEGIEAGCGIKAKTFISSEKRIFAGISVYKTSSNCDKTIKCENLIKGEICYGELIVTKQEMVEMTIAEIEQKLGVKNLKVIK